VRRIVGQSIVFVYGYRDHGSAPIHETRPPEVGGRFDSVLAPLRYMEDRLLRTAGLEGVALRYGLFYSASSPSVTFMLRMLRRRMMRLPGGGTGVTPFIHIEDAAEATVRALEEAPAGAVYNVVDDEPAAWRDFVGELARLHGTPPPGSVPLPVARLALPYAAYFMARVRLPVSNARAREELGWSPSHPTYREGLAAASEPIAA
jgi:nucleoside-diphosphate-sugar epimerase